MNDFKTSNEIGSIYQDILSRELLNYGIVIQCHTSKFMQLNYGENPQGIEIKHDSKIVEKIKFSLSLVQETKIAISLLKVALKRKITLGFT